MNDTGYEKFKEKIASLEKFYWSPNRPEFYRLSDNSGLGLLANLDYGAFNLVFHLTPLKSRLDHVNASKAFILQRSLNEQVVNGQTLSEWATLLSLRDFQAWFHRSRHWLAPPTITHVAHCLRQAEASQKA